MPLLLMNIFLWIMYLFTMTLCYFSGISVSDAFVIYFCKIGKNNDLNLLVSVHDSILPFLLDWEWKMEAVWVEEVAR